MASVYNDNNQVNAPKNIDNKKGRFVSGAWRPYNDVTEANTTVLQAYRSKGQEVYILKDGVLTEYWWRDGVADGDLIEKTTSGSITIDPTPTNGSDNAVASNGVFDALATKQDTLVSGTNIKTINGTTVLGSGDITISGGTIDAVPTDGSSNAVSSNGTFDALALKAPLASPTFTGTVSGITKTMVGLGNADNTTDANKPVSTAQQTALDLKANLASPTFTGTVVLPSTTSIGTVSSIEIGYIDGVTSAIQTQLDKKGSRNWIDFVGKTIDWFGDSYTSGTGATSVTKRFTSLVSNILGATEVNHGVAGTTIQKRTPIDYMASPNMVDNVSNIPTKTSSKALLVFAFGLNDMGQTAAAYNTTNYITDYNTVLSNAFSKGWDGSQILLIAPYYIGSAGYSAYATITGNAAPDVTRHLSFIEATKQIADSNGTLFLDIYQDQKKNNITLIDADNIHATDAGHAYIAYDVLQLFYKGKERYYEGYALSDEDLDLSTKTAAVTFMSPPYDMYLKDIRIEVGAASVGANIQVDVKFVGGSSIFSTILSIDASEKTSITASTPYVLSTTVIPANSAMQADIVQVGTTTKGKALKLKYTAFI